MGDTGLVNPLQWSLLSVHVNSNINSYPAQIPINHLLRKTPTLTCPMAVTITHVFGGCTFQIQSLIYSQHTCPTRFMIRHLLHMICSHVMLGHCLWPNKLMDSKARERHR
ncbi:hypothetical protein AMTRI_Chr08g207380 [Amborella trichopoda]